MPDASNVQLTFIDEVDQFKPEFALTGEMNTLSNSTGAPIDTSNVVLQFIDNSGDIAQPMELDELQDGQPAVTEDVQLEFNVNNRFMANIANRWGI